MDDLIFGFFHWCYDALSPVIMALVETFGPVVIVAMIIGFIIGLVRGDTPFRERFGSRRQNDDVEVVPGTVIDRRQ